MADTCRLYYPLYYNALRLTGLWPYDETLLMKALRFIYLILVACTMIIQGSTLRYVDITVSNLIVLLSFGFCMVLTILRYIGFTVNFPVFREMFDNMERDSNAIKDPAETELVMKHVIETRRVIVLLLGISCAGLVMLVMFFIVIPALFLPNSQTEYLHMLGFFYPETSMESTVVAIQIVFVTTIALFGVSCTELSLAVFSSYFCGLFEVASYRFETAVNMLANSENQNVLIDIRSAVKLHQRVLELTSMFTNELTLSYLAAILAVVASFAISLYRLYLAFLMLEDVENFLISLQIFMIHVLIMFVNNYSGQKLMNSSIEIFTKTYNSLWYRIPPQSQKLMLFVLMKSITVVQFNLAGLFNPCFEGFNMMMSSSFSYFTALLSF